MLIKFNLFAQVFFLLGSAINSLLFYFFRGNENLSLTLYVLMFFAQVFIIISCIVDVVLDKSVNKFMVFSVGIIYVATVLFFGSGTDTFLYKALLLFSMLMLALYLRSKFSKLK